MIILEKLEDLKKYYNSEENSYNFNEDIKIKFDLKIKASLTVTGDINACNIDAWDINARNIDACNIDAWDIDAGDINACNIDAWDINAGNINARNIDAWNINAGNIKYYAFVVAYESFRCISATAIRENGIALCLDQPIFYKDKENK